MNTAIINIEWDGEPCVLGIILAQMLYFLTTIIHILFLKKVKEPSAHPSRWHVRQPGQKKAQRPEGRRKKDSGLWEYMDRGWFNPDLGR